MSIIKAVLKSFGFVKEDKMPVPKTAYEIMLDWSSSHSDSRYISSPIREGVEEFFNAVLGYATKMFADNKHPLPGYTLIPYLAFVPGPTLDRVAFRIALSADDQSTLTKSRRAQNEFNEVNTELLNRIVTVEIDTILMGSVVTKRARDGKSGYVTYPLLDGNVYDYNVIAIDIAHFLCANKKSVSFN